MWNMNTIDHSELKSSFENKFVDEQTDGQKEDGRTDRRVGLLLQGACFSSLYSVSTCVMWSFLANLCLSFVSLTFCTFLEVYPKRGQNCRYYVTLTFCTFLDVYLKGVKIVDIIYFVHLSGLFSPPWYRGKNAQFLWYKINWYNYMTFWH